MTGLPSVDKTAGTSTAKSLQTALMGFILVMTYEMSYKSEIDKQFDLSSRCGIARIIRL